METNLEIVGELADSIANLIESVLQAAGQASRDDLRKRLVDFVVDAGSAVMQQGRLAYVAYVSQIILNLTLLELGIIS